MKPAGRTEVIQLQHTMDALLNRVGADAIDEKGPTQLHNLLEIIKQEQDIYNIVFHEIIRQVKFTFFFFFFWSDLDNILS